MLIKVTTLYADLINQKYTTSSKDSINIDRNNSEEDDGESSAQSERQKGQRRNRN